MIYLSVLIPTLHSRQFIFVSMMQNLAKQIKALENKKEVQILTCTDNRQRTTGDKRNQLLEQSSGKFVVFVDGVDIVYDETIASSVRTLTISFPYGSEEIKITGSYVDPEFGLPSLSEPGLNPAISESNQEFRTLESVSQDVKGKEISVTSSDYSFLTMFAIIAAITFGAVLIAVLKGIL